MVAAAAAAAAAAGGKFTAHDSPFIASRPPHVSSGCRLVSFTMLAVFGAECQRVGGNILPCTTQHDPISFALCDIIKKVNISHTKVATTTEHSITKICMRRWKPTLAEGGLRRMRFVVS